MTGTTVDDLLTVIGDGLPDPDEPELRDGEKAMVRDLFEGSQATLGPDNIRAVVLRRLCMHSDMVRGGQPGRFWIKGGVIEGTPPVDPDTQDPPNLNLTGLHLDFGLQFKDVDLPHLVLSDARLLSLELLGGSAAGIEGDRLEIAHDFLMGGSFTSTDAIFLRSADIGGDLNCSGGRFEPECGPSLMLDGARIGGRLYLQKDGPDFHAKHGVYGHNTRISGAVICTHGRFDREFEFPQAQVQGDFVLDHADIGSQKKNKKGQLNALLLLHGMHVSGVLSMLETNFHGPLILLSRTRVDGTMRWGVKRTDPAAESLEVDLTQAHFGYLEDDLDRWHEAEMRLEGFTFDGVAVGGKNWLQDRKAWLNLQPEGRWSPDPYDQMRAALQKSGHEADAREIAVEREEVRGTKGGLSWLGKRVHWLYGLLLGYGYKPFRFFVASALIVLVCWGVFTGFGLFSFGLETCNRTNEIANAEKAAKTGGTDSAKLPTDCGGFAFPSNEAAPYHSFLFALDAFVPVDLGQTSEWHPRANGYIYVLTAEIALGWLFAGLLLGAVTGVLRRD
jgi:hypothetical protein